MPVKRTSRKSAPAHSLVRGSHSHSVWDDALEGDDDHDDSGMDMSGGASGGGSSEIREIEESLKRSMAVDVSLLVLCRLWFVPESYDNHDFVPEIVRVRSCEGM